LAVEELRNNCFYKNQKRFDERELRRTVPFVFELLFSLVLAGSAVAVRSVNALLILGVLNILYWWYGRLGGKFILRAGRMLLWQAALLVMLHYLRFGEQGLIPGMRVSVQLFLAFLPGMILLHSSSRSQLVRLMNYVLPSMAAFVFASSLHFVPLLMRELKDLYYSQLLRGARLDISDIYKPWCWGDWVSSYIVPAVVLTFALAGDIAVAAKIRDFDCCRKRTNWSPAVASVKDNYENT